MSSEPPQAEFVGGPEDGRFLDEDLLRQLGPTLDAGDEGRIPLLLRGDETASFEPGDEIEVVLLGFYVREKGSNPPKFRWIQK